MVESPKKERKKERKRERENKDLFIKTKKDYNVMNCHENCL